MVMTAMYGINKVGLRERPSYDQLIGYLQGGQEKIKYPDRFAKRVRETPQLSNLLDGEGFSVNDINEQQINHAKEIAKQLAILQAGGDAHLLRVSSQPPSNVNPPQDNSNGQDFSDAISVATDTNDNNKENQRNKFLSKEVQADLDKVDEEQRLAIHNIIPPRTEQVKQPSSSSDEGISDTPPVIDDPASSSSALPASAFTEPTYRAYDMEDREQEILHMLVGMRAEELKRRYKVPSRVQGRRKIVEHIATNLLRRPLSQPAMDYIKKSKLPQKREEGSRSSSP